MKDVKNFQLFYFLVASYFEKATKHQTDKKNVSFLEELKMLQENLKALKSGVFCFSLCHVCPILIFYHIVFSFTSHWMFVGSFAETNCKFLTNLPGIMIKLRKVIV